MDENRLITKIKSGDREAFREIIERYQNYVYTLALRVVKKREYAEEVTQDVFLRVFYKIDSFEGNSKFSTWLFSIVYRLSLNYSKKVSGKLDKEVELKSHIEFAEKENTHLPNEPLNRVETQAALWQAIDCLETTQGVVISLFYLQEFSIAEITEVLQIPQNTVKTHLYRGRKKLKAELSKSYAPEDLL